MGVVNNTGNPGGEKGSSYATTGNGNKKGPGQRKIAEISHLDTEFHV